MLVPVVYRDFRFYNPAEFEANLGGSVSVAYPGMVQNDLDSDGKPVYTGLTGGNIEVTSSATFAEWYRNTDGVNHATATTLALWDNHNGTYVNRWGSNGEQWTVTTTGHTLDGNPLFFPVDGDMFTPASELTPAEIPSPYAASGTFDLDSAGVRRQHNFSFTSEIRYWFKYEAAQSLQLDVLGDDDIWVFINKKLAIDVGGIHLPRPGSVTLDATMATTLGLTDGNVYEVAVFQAERRIDTSTFRFDLAGFNTAPSACKPN
jgi:fibro-slime domain-containing protein